MKRAEGKFIGINQRVPFRVLDQGLFRFLQQGQLHRSDVLSDMLEVTGGRNRASKAAGYAVTVLSRPQAPLEELKAQLSAEDYMNLPDQERKVILMALLACTYPVAYDLMVILGSGFKVQPKINRAWINQKMAALYGSNRTLDIALDALLPMLIELGVMQREKTGIYAACPPYVPRLSISSVLYIYADLHCSGSKSILLDDLQSRPWYRFCTVRFDVQAARYVLRLVEGSVGGGYVGLG